MIARSNETRDVIVLFARYDDLVVLLQEKEGDYAAFHKFPGIRRFGRQRISEVIGGGFQRQLGITLPPGRCKHVRDQVEVGSSLKYVRSIELTLEELQAITVHTSNPTSQHKLYLHPFGDLDTLDSLKKSHRELVLFLNRPPPS